MPMTPEIATAHAESLEKWIAATQEATRVRLREMPDAVPVLPGTFTLHIATPSGQHTTVDITDAVNRASFTHWPTEGDPTPVDVSEALPGDPAPRLVHRIMLVTCHNPGGTSDQPIMIDPEAERWIKVARQQAQASHGDMEAKSLGNEPQIANGRAICGAPDPGLRGLVAQAAALSNPHILQAAASSERIWNTLTTKQPMPPVIQIDGNDGRLIVSIHPDGRVELGPGASTDEAAQAFWDAVRRVIAGGAA